MMRNAIFAAVWLTLVAVVVAPIFWPSASWLAGIPFWAVVLLVLVLWALVLIDIPKVLPKTARQKSSAGSSIARTSEPRDS
jgi:FtsH-binding integral membrane protein